MDKKICSSESSIDDPILVTEKLTTKEECSTTSRFTLTVTEQSNAKDCSSLQQTFQFSSSSISNDNANNKKNTSSRSELFAAKISSSSNFSTNNTITSITSKISKHFHSNSISNPTTSTGNSTLVDTLTNTSLTNTSSSASASTSSTNVQTNSQNCATLCTSKTAPASCRRRRPRIKLNLQPDVVGQPQCSTRMYSASAPNSLNPKNICMYPIDSGYASPRGPDHGGLYSREHGVRVLPNLYISGEDEARNPKFLKHHEIQAILSIQLNELALEPRKHVQNYKHIKLQDRPDVNISEHFEEAIRFIDENTRTLVHCQAGISRSATLCLAYLIQKQQITLETAFKQLQRNRGCIGPNFSFLGQLKTWEGHVLNKNLMNKELPQRQTSTGIESISSADNSPDYKKMIEK